MLLSHIQPSLHNYWPHFLLPSSSLPSSSSASFSSNMGCTNFLLFFFLEALLFACYLPTSSSKTAPEDVKALRLLKASIDPSSIPPSSCLASWSFTNADPCDSLFSAEHFTCGLRCDVTNPSSGLSRVTEISLDPAGYSGSLPSSVWSLPFLQTLDVPDNLLTGPIPTTSLSPELRRVTLSRNAFSGAFPSTLLVPSLEELYLDENRLSGRLPSTLPNLPRLKRLELQSNNLSGELPSNMHHALSALYHLDLSDNSFVGRLPTALPRYLVQFSSRNNRLEGPIPSSLAFDDAILQVVDLSNNALTGSVPGSLFCHPSLQQLVLTGNQLRSLESPQWGCVARSELVALDVARNKVEGNLPSWLAALPRLQALSLEGNRITGMIPWAYAARAFSRLLLAGNYLYGPIPSPLLTATRRDGGDAVLSLADNCLFRCPEIFFFCRGGRQKGTNECRELNPFIP